MQQCGKRLNDSQWQRDKCSHTDRLRLFQTPPKNSHLRLAELLANRLAVTDPRGRYFSFFSFSVFLTTCSINKDGVCPHTLLNSSRLFNH